VPSAEGSKVSLPSMSASVSTTRPPVALAMRLHRGERGVVETQGENYSRPA
jgi:hypothetical protein